jgi:hypothetical protein
VDAGARNVALLEYSRRGDRSAVRVRNSSGSGGSRREKASGILGKGACLGGSGSCHHGMNAVSERAGRLLGVMGFTCSASAGAKRHQMQMDRELPVKNMCNA